MTMPSPEVLARLRERVAIWLGLTPPDLDAFDGYWTPCRFAAGEHLCGLGDPANDAVVLSDGVVRAYHLLQDKEINLRLLDGPAIALPYRSFLEHRPADEALQALTAVRGVRVRLRAFCRDHPGWLVERTLRRLAEAHVLTLQHRLRLLQGRRAADRYETFLATVSADLMARTPAYHIASYLGITSESLSRLRRERER